MKHSIDRAITSGLFAAAVLALASGTAVADSHNATEGHDSAAGQADMQQHEAGPNPKIENLQKQLNQYEDHQGSPPAASSSQSATTNEAAGTSGPSEKSQQLQRKLNEYERHQGTPPTDSTSNGTAESSGEAADEQSGANPKIKNLQDRLNEYENTAQ